MANISSISSPYDDITAPADLSVPTPDVVQPILPKAPEAAPQTTDDSADTDEPVATGTRGVNGSLPPAQYMSMFIDAAKKYDVPVNVVMALGDQESGYNPKAVGQQTQWGTAKGMMQFLDSTAKGNGIDPHDPAQSIDQVAKDLKQRLDKGYSVEDAIKEHFGGPNRNMWKSKTTAYGQEVLKRAGDIQALLSGTIDSSDTSSQASIDAINDQTQAPSDDPKTGNFGTDLLHNLKIGANQAALDLREAFHKASPATADFIDKVDKYFHPEVKNSEELLKKDSATQTAALTQQMQDSMKKGWIVQNEDGSHSIGPAWSDPNAYIGGITQGAPEMAATMLPVLRLAKAAYAAKIALGATEAVAASSAANAASATGAILQYITGGAQASRAVRDTINDLPENVLQNSQAYQAMIAQGVPPKQARSQLAENQSSQAFLVAGVASAAFAGAGDRVLAKIITDRTGKGLVSRVLIGAGKDAAAQSALNPGQAAAQKLAENSAVQTANPDQSLSEGVADAAGSALGTGLAQGGIMGGFSGARNVHGSQPVQPAQPETPIPQLPMKDINPVPSKTAPVTAPVRPMSDALNAAAQRPGAQVTGEDGKVYNMTAGPDGLKVAPAVEAGPMTSALNDAAAHHAENPVAEITAPESSVPMPVPEPEKAVKPAQEKTESVSEPVAKKESAAETTKKPADVDGDGVVQQKPVEEVAPPAKQPTLSELTDDQLQERKQYVQAHGKTNGWNPTTIKARDEVNREIRNRQKQAKSSDGNADVPASVKNDSDSTPAGETAVVATDAVPSGDGQKPADVKPKGTDEAAIAKKWFGKQDNAENYITKNGLQDTHEAIKVSPIRYEIKPKGNAPAEPVSSFTTSKGSQYVVHEDGTTTRDKAARSDPGHEGDAGIKKRTEKTIYVADDAIRLSAAGMSNLGEKGPRVAIKDGKATLVTWNEAKQQWGASPSAKGIAVSDTPAVGMHPLELWNKTSDVPGHESYSGMHAGNKITEMATPVAEKVPAAKQPAEVAPTAAPVPSGKKINKWFGTEDQAKSFIERKGLAADHDVFKSPDGGFDVRPVKTEAPTQEIHNESPESRTEESTGKSTGEGTSKESPANEIRGSDDAAQEETGRVLNQPEQPVEKAPAEEASTTPPDEPPEPPPAKAENPDAKFKDNKIFTADKVAEARERLKKKLNPTGLNRNQGGSIDPDVFRDGIFLAGAHIESGARTFSAYAKSMIEDIGHAIKPYLLSLYEGVRYYPGVETDGMSTSKVAQKLHAAMMAEEEESHVNSKPAQDDNRPSVQEQEPAPVRNDESVRAAEPVSEPRPNDAGNDAGRTEATADRSGNDRREPELRGEPDSKSADVSELLPASGRDGAESSDGKPASAIGRNYRIADGELKQPATGYKRAERNIEIIELMKKIQDEGRMATPEEKSLIAQYTGWGATDVQDVFPVNGLFKSQPGRELNARLQAALTPEQYDSVKRSTQYAHYTPEHVVRAIYDGLDRMGFKGGTVLEPGMGVGHFAGMMPDHMASTSHYTGVEYDPLSAAISKVLYPEANVIEGDFSKTAFPQDFFDAAVGNPPFSSVKVTNDSEYKKLSPQLHDYFIMKSLDRVKQGGLLAFVTSTGTMDKVSDRVRTYLADRANLVGAIRLPEDQFRSAGTTTATDVLFLQKKGAGIADNGIAWTGTKEISTKYGAPTSINEYFADHPDMVLGDHAIRTSQYGERYTVSPRSEEDVQAGISKAIGQLPENIVRPPRGSMAERAVVQDRDFNPKHKKEGGLYIGDDGRLMQVEDGAGKELITRIGSDGSEKTLAPKQTQWLSDYVGVRDALKQTQFDQLNDGPWEKSLANLNKVYDAFVKKNGNFLEYSTIERLNPDQTISETKRYKNEPLLRLDTEGALAYALEKVNQDGTISRGVVLDQRVLKKPAEPVIKTTNDALFVSLGRTGALNIDDVAALAGTDRQTAIRDLGNAVYESPNGTWQLADEYKSGDVRKKLKEAQAAAKINKKYQRNVDALMEVQPRPLGPKDVSVRLGANWVPPKDISSFAQEVLGQKADVSYSHTLNDWTVNPIGRGEIGQWATDRISSAELLDSVLNNRQIKVTYKDPVTKKQIVDLVATEKANDIATKMKDAYRSWIWRDPERATRLLDHYNENFNNIAPRTFDGSHLTLPGVSMRFKLFDHQKRAIWRTIQDGDVYYAHAVGAGKTMEMIGSAMEERRLGLTKKPIMVVPNHMLGQFSREFLEMYPTAKIMVADDHNFHSANRKKFLAQAALNDPDAIVITHSAFGRVGMSDEFQARFIKNQIAEWEDAKASSGDKITVKQIERRIEGLEKKLEKATLEGKKDRVMNFEDLGVDRMYVDEMHEFRKLDFATNQGNIKGIDPNGSQKSMDLYMKNQYLREKNKGRTLVGASGTPVTNTMGELYTFQRFFQPEQLEHDGLTNFDAWASQYGDVVNGFEQNAAGGYDMVNRFAKFQNVPELMRRVRSKMDILTTNNLGELVQRPDVSGGSRKIVITPVPDGYKEYQKSLEARIKAIQQRRGPPAKGDDIILKVISDGRFSAIDMRFVNPELPSDPNSKLNKWIDAMIHDHQSTKDFEYIDPETSKPYSKKGAATMGFADIGLGEASAENRGFNMRAWIEKRFADAGIPKSEIAFMRDYKQAAKKERMFAEMRNGQKRILIGGKEMETGTNVQQRLIGLHHLDAPWFPASVEQREGRIIRQGNQNSEVGVTAYATKGSYDSTMWGMNARKAKFIEQAMNGDDAIRGLEDVSEASAFEMAAALASGDERYMKLAGLKSDVDRFERLRQAHHDEQASLMRRQNQAQASLKMDTFLASDLEKAIKDIPIIKANEFIGKIGDTSYENREKFSQDVFKKFQELVDSRLDAAVRIGDVGGAGIQYDGWGTEDNFHASLTTDLPGSNELVLFPYDPDMAVNGIATRVVNQIFNMPGRLVEVQNRIKMAESTLKQVEKRIGAPFPEEQLLIEKMNELDDLQTQLVKENENTSAEAAVATPKSEYGKPEEPKFSRGNGDGSAKWEVEMALKRGDMGDAVDRMIKQGSLVIHETPDTLPGVAKGQDVQAVTMPDGTIHMVSSNIGPNDANGVLLHEAFHAGGEALIGSSEWTKLQRRLDSLHRQFKESSGIAKEYFDKARERVAHANEDGTMSPEMTAEEFGAYAIEEHANAPASVRKWASDVMGAIKAWILKKFGKQIGDLTPAQLVQISKAALQDGQMNSRMTDPRYSVGQPQREAPKELTPEDQSMIKRAQAFVQDNFNRVNEVQKNIEKVTGQTLSEWSDVYLAKDNQPGRAAARLEDAKLDLIKPLLTKLGESKYTPAELASLAHAMHAEERNAKIYSIDSTQQSGSGMTDKEAQAIKEKYKNDTELRAMVKDLHDISNATLDLKLAGGLITQNYYDDVKARYKNYVPLKGDNNFGPTLKRAMGHGARDEFIIEHVARDLEQAIVAVERNKVRGALANLVTEHPDPELYSIGLPPMGKKIVQENGFQVVYKDGSPIAKFKTRTEAERHAELYADINLEDHQNYDVERAQGEKIQEYVKPLQDNEVIYYAQGRPVRIQINDPVMASQMRPLRQNPGAMQFYIDKMKAFHRHFTRVYTAYSPTFIFSNIFRDANTGTVTMAGNYGAKIAAKAWLNYPAASSALFMHAVGKTLPGEMGQMVKEYRMEGGKMGASHMSDLEAQTTNLQKMYDDAHGAMRYAKDGKPVKAAQIASRKIIGGMAHAVEILNQTTENALRLSLYSTLRKEGVSKARSAQAAKNVTVNFDKKGAATPFLGATYLFFNPAVQGTANALHALTQGKHKGQAWAALGMMAGAGFYLAAQAMDTDKDRWLGRSWDQRTNNLMVHIGNHTLSIPLSQEYSPAYAFGVAMAEATRGVSKMKTSINMLQSFLSAFFPTKGTFDFDSKNPMASAAMSLVPTAARPVADLIANRNSFGNQIAPETDATKDRPDNLKMYRGTKGSVYDKAAQGIANAGVWTGLTHPYENDLTKVSPETLKYLSNTYFGGLGNAVMDSVGVGLSAMNPEDRTELKNVPIVKRFWQEDNVNPIRTRFYDLYDESKEATSEMQNAIKARDIQGARDVVDSKRTIIAANGMMKSTAKATGMLRDQMVTVNGDDKLTPSQKKDKLKELEAREEEIYRRAIGVFKN